MRSKLSTSSHYTTRATTSTKGAATPAASSSIYWDSVDSSGGSSGSAGDRHYVDPWDLENYVYLRSHGVAAAASISGALASPTPQPIYQRTNGGGRSGLSSSRLSHRSSRHIEPDYWYAPSVREPTVYETPVDEIYYKPRISSSISSRSMHHDHHHHQHHQQARSNYSYYHQQQHQPIYEDETMSHYAAPMPLYSYLSEFDQAEALEELRMREMTRRRNKLARSRLYQSREECYYHRRPSEILMMDIPPPPPSRAISRRRIVHDDYEDDDILIDSELMEEIETIRYKEAFKPRSRIMLNTNGHLKIDYTSNWNSLYRKIINK